MIFNSAGFDILQKLLPLHVDDGQFDGHSIQVYCLPQPFHSTAVKFTCSSSLPSKR